MYRVKIKRMASFFITLSLIVAMFFPSLSYVGAEGVFKEVDIDKVPTSSFTSFRDSDQSKGEVKGELIWNPVSDEAQISGYVIYFLDNNDKKLDLIAQIKPGSQLFGKGSYVFQIADNTLIPKGAMKIGIFVRNSEGVAKKGLIYGIWDSPLYEVYQIDFVDNNSAAGKINATVKWQTLQDESHISSYVLRFFDNKDKAIKTIEEVKPGQKKNEITLQNTDIPTDAYKIGVHTKDHDGNISVFGAMTNVTDSAIGEDIPELPVIKGLPAPKNVSASIREVSFSNPVQYLGEVKIEASDDRSQITGYNIYVLDGKNQKIDYLGEVILSSGDKYYTFDIPAGFNFSNEATRIGVFAKNDKGESDNYGFDPIAIAVKAKNVIFIDNDPLAGKIIGQLHWEVEDETRLSSYEVAIHYNTSDTDIYDIEKTVLEVKKGKSAYTIDIPVTSLDDEDLWSIRIYVKNENGDRIQQIDTYFVDDMSGTPAVESEGVNIPVPDKVKFRDSDPDADEIGGLFQLESTPMDFKRAALYFLDGSGNKLGGILELIPSANEYIIPDGTKVPEGAKAIGVFNKNHSGISKESADVSLTYKSYIPYKERGITKKEVVFPDLPQKGKEYISGTATELAAYGIISGYSDGKFYPDRLVTRAEFSSMLMRGLGHGSSKDFKGLFSDVKENAWYARDVEAAANAGLLGGYKDGTFKPNNHITNEEMAVMVMNAMKSTGSTYMHFAQTMDMEEELSIYKDQSKIQPWAKEAVASTLAVGIYNIGKNVKEDYFDPAQPATREQCVNMLYQLLMKLN